jgi:hypothetical protein
MGPRLRGDDVVLRAVHCFLLSAFCPLSNYLDVSGGIAEVSRTLRLVVSP